MSSECRAGWLKDEVIGLRIRQYSSKSLLPHHHHDTLRCTHADARRSPSLASGSPRLGRGVWWWKVDGACCLLASLEIQELKPPRPRKKMGEARQNVT